MSDNMSKSSDKSKKGCSKKVSKAIGKLKDDRFNCSEGARTQAGTSAGASMLGRTYVPRMKNLKMKMPTNDSGSDTNED